MTQKRKGYIAALLFILPSFVGIVIFYIIPYIICFVQSLFSGGSFVGLGNYIDIFKNKTFMVAITNTAVFTIIAIPLLMIISFILASFLNSFKRISSFFRSALLVPVVIPVASLICVWKVLFEDKGAINGLLSFWGHNAVEFFNSWISMAILILIYIWKYCGFCVVLFTAALANIPSSYIESARLDGASPIKIIIKVKIPIITPTIFFVFLMELIYSFKIYREAFSLFGEYPNKNVYLIQNFVNNNYNNLNFPRLSAGSIILSVFIIGVLFAFFIWERKRSYLE